MVIWGLMAIEKCAVIEIISKYKNCVKGKAVALN
jgi:hypothetical protein